MHTLRLPSTFRSTSTHVPAAAGVVFATVHAARNPANKVRAEAVALQALLAAGDSGGGEQQASTATC